MVKTLTTLILLLCVGFTADAQLKIFHEGESEDLNGQTIMVDEFASADFMDLPLNVLNEGTTEMVLRARRTEVDVVAGTEHGVCWVVCPYPDLVAGEQPVYIVNLSGSGMVETIQPGDTVDTFSMHYVTNGMLGSSEFLIEFIDPNDVVVAGFTVEFSTPVGLNEQLAQADVTLAPNPANENVRLTVDGIDSQLEVRLFDLLGQSVMSTVVNGNASAGVELETSSLRNGIYFVSLGENGKAYRTMKLVVKH